MKMKKLVSAIAALAMSVSAFAGLTVQAAVEEVDFIGSSTTAETFDDYAGTGWASEGFTWNTASYGSLFGPGSVTEIAKPEIGNSISVTNEDGTTTDNYPTYVSGSTYMNRKRGKGTMTSTYAVSPVYNGKVYFNGDVYLVSNPLGNNDGASMSIIDADGNDVIKFGIPHNGGRFTVNGKYDSKVTGKARTAGLGANIDVIADLDTGSASVTVDMTDYGTKVRVVSEFTIDISTATSIAGLSLSSNSRSSTSNDLHLDNVKFYALTDKEAVSTAVYTVNYVFDSKVIKSVDGNGLVGSAPVIDMDAIWSDDATTKYFCVSNDLGDNTIKADDSLVITVTLETADTYSYTVNSNLGTEIATGTVIEGETAKVAYPRYINNGGTLYEKGAINKEYRYGLTATEDNYVDTLEYSATEISNVVYYSEAELVEGVTLTTKNNIPIRSSNALAAYAAEDVVLTTLQPGVYKVYGNVYSNSSGGANLNFALGENKFDFTVTGASNGTGVESDAITISEATDLKFLASGSDGAALDYIYVVKTGDVATTTTDAWAFDTIDIDTYNSGTLEIDYSEDGGTTTTTVGIVMSDLLSTYADTKLTGEGSISFAIIITGIEEGTTITEARILPPTDDGEVAAMAGDMEADAADASDVIEIGNTGFDVE